MCVYITSLAGMINEAAIADYQFKKALARGGRPSLMETCVVHARGFTRPEPDVFFRVRYNSGEINRSHYLSLSLLEGSEREEKLFTRGRETYRLMWKKKLPRSFLSGIAPAVDRVSSPAGERGFFRACA